MGIADVAAVAVAAPFGGWLATPGRAGPPYFLCAFTFAYSNDSQIYPPEFINYSMFVSGVIGLAMAIFLFFNIALYWRLRERIAFLKTVAVGNAAQDPETLLTRQIVTVSYSVFLDCLHQ